MTSSNLNMPKEKRTLGKNSRKELWKVYVGVSRHSSLKEIEMLYQRLSENSGFWPEDVTYIIVDGLSTTGTTVSSSDVRKTPGRNGLISYGEQCRV
jgi:hypothetical protein